MGLKIPMTRFPRPGFIRIGVAALLPALFIAQPVRADDEDTLNLSAGIAVLHDDNLFRLSPGVDPNTVLGKSTKSDDITTATVGLKLNKRYSLQQFELDASLVDYRYRTFSYLDFTAANYAAAWRWSLTPYLHGNLTSDRKESLNSFSDYSGYRTRNLRTDENKRFDAVLEVSGSWRVLGGIARSTRINSQLFLEEGDTRLDTAEGGLRYDFPSGTKLSYIARDGRGDYFNRDQPIVATRLDNQFDQRENEVRLIWPVTEKTTIDARAAHIERTHEHFGDRDYAGNVGALNVSWQVTDKTSVMAGFGRELSSYQSTDSSYISTDRFTLSPAWQISAKTTLRGRYDYAQRDYRGAIAATPLSDRVDTQHTAMIAFEWQALRALSLSASLQNDKRTSNQSGHDYKDTQAGVSAQLAF